MIWIKSLTTTIVLIILAIVLFPVKETKQYTILELSPIALETEYAVVLVDETSEINVNTTIEIVIVSPSQYHTLEEGQVVTVVTYNSWLFNLPLYTYIKE